MLPLSKSFQKRTVFLQDCENINGAKCNSKKSSQVNEITKGGGFCFSGQLINTFMEKKQTIYTFFLLYIVTSVVFVDDSFDMFRGKH